MGVSRPTGPPKLSTNTYARLNKPVLRRPVESGQYTAIRYADRLADAGAVASIGSVGDSLLTGQSG